MYYLKFQIFKSKKSSFICFYPALLIMARSIFTREGKIFIAFTGSVLGGGKQLIYLRVKTANNRPISLLFPEGLVQVGVVFFFLLWLQYYQTCLDSLSIVASVPDPPWPCLTAQCCVYRRSEHHLSTLFAWSTFSDLSFSAAYWGQLCKTDVAPHRWWLATLIGALLWNVTHVTWMSS